MTEKSRTEHSARNAMVVALSQIIAITMGYFIHDADDVEHILPIYLLFLASSVVSCLIVYKKTLADARQLNYIGALCQTIFLAIQYVFQIAVLIATRNFILFLLIYLFCTIASNICIVWKADRAAEGRGRELDVTDRTLLEILRDALAGKEPPARREFTEGEWGTLVQKADRHAVLSLLYDALDGQPLSNAQSETVTRVSRRVVLQSYRLSFCTHRITGLLKERGIAAVVLKGVSAAAVYPTPELRKSGDIDILLLDPEQLILARDTLLKAGYAKAENQTANHHLIMHYEAGIELELHTMLAEPFDNAKMNHYLRGCLRDISGHIEQRNVMGYEIPVLSEGYQAYQLLLHMLQHFLRSGFGLKLLCDWFFFWKRPVAEEEIRLYLKLAEESGLSGFSRMVTSLCVSYLGLDRDCGLCVRMDGLMEEAEARGFMGDILEAEEFGKSSRDRMVLLRGTRLRDYVREFHHMMRLNFPKAGSVFLLWPVLWCVTLLRFLNNNRKIRGVTAGEVLKKARERSDSMERLELFKTRSGNTGRSRLKEKTEKKV